MKDKNKKKPVLTERQKTVVECIRMRLTNTQALEYLTHNGFKMSQSTLTREKRYVESKKLERIFEIGMIGFEDQHIDRIDNLQVIEKLMWNNYHAQEDSFKRVIILEKLAALQPYVAKFYESTRYVIEKDPKIKSMWQAHLAHLAEKRQEALRLRAYEMEKIYIEGNNDMDTNLKFPEQPLLELDKDIGSDLIDEQSGQGEQADDLHNSGDSREGSSETTAEDKESDEARYRRLKDDFIF